jgi:hypothetical protein
VLESRALIYVLLVVSLVAGGAPWRVASHEHDGHGRVWLPDLAHVHESHARDGHVHAHDGPCTHGTHDSEEPACPEESDHGDCHCDDQALVTGMPYATVALDAHALLEGTLARVDGRRALGVPEVAPSETRLRRVACEEDPIVLLR